MEVGELLKQYWSIFTFIVGGIVLAVRQESKVKELIEKDKLQQEHINKLEAKIDVTHGRIEKMEQNIVKMLTTLEFIREELAKSR